MSKISKERRKQTNRPRSSGRIARALNSESTLQPPVLFLSPTCVSYTETTHSIQDWVYVPSICKSLILEQRIWRWNSSILTFCVSHFYRRLKLINTFPSIGSSNMSWTKSRRGQRWQNLRSINSKLKQRSLKKRYDLLWKTLRPVALGLTTLHGLI